MTRPTAIGVAEPDDRNHLLGLLREMLWVALLTKIRKSA